MLRPALWLLLAMTLAGRVAAMPGWMPVAGAHGFEIALCNGGTMTMPMAGKQGVPGKHQTAECPYAAAAHAGGMADASSLHVALLQTAKPTPLTAIRSIVSGRALRLPPSTGPPRLG